MFISYIGTRDERHFSMGLNPNSGFEQKILPATAFFVDGLHELQTKSAVFIYHDDLKVGTNAT